MQAEVIQRSGAENAAAAGQRKKDKKNFFWTFLCGPLRSLRLCGK